MKTLSGVLVILLLLLGAGLVYLSARVYRQTGNTAAAVYAAVLTVGVVSGAVAVWRNSRGPKKTLRNS